MGALLRQKEIPNKRYTAECKKQVVKAVIQDGLSYQEAARIYEVQGHGRIQSWERIYQEEGAELSVGGAVDAVNRNSCQVRCKRICSPRFNGCVRKTLT
ncbi:transposase [Candidatus Agathobaculum pullicola]|uniref:transposase n=1 Tax=Candidatus Agathobaculum pullicola TaxID=2838426 RepID=UPI003F8DCB2A